MLGEEDRRALLKVAVRRRYGKGEVVFHEGDPGDALHIVTAGVFIARSLSTRGEMIAVNVFSEGGVFGELALLTESDRRSATLVSWREGATMLITRADFEGLRARQPTVDRFLVNALAERNRALNEHLVELLFMPADKRVYRRLLWFAGVVAPAGDDGWVSLSQGELAILAGTTRPTVNRALRRAEARGLVRLGRGRIRVVDAEGLRQRAGDVGTAVPA
jgi:CRP/FNR family transcriptional regulator, cyclic AMP receptor protein